MMKMGWCGVVWGGVMWFCAVMWFGDDVMLWCGAVRCDAIVMMM